MTHRGRRGFAVAAVAGAIVFVAALGALAYWTTSGTGTASASSGTLSAASISAPGTSAGNVTITWDTQAAMTPASQNSSITYTVERKLGAGAFAAIGSGPCSGARAFGTSSCVDTVGANGTYTYRVVAYFSTAWTAVSNEVTVTVTIDTTPPTISSINRSDPSPTNAGTVNWTVTFSEAVAGVDASDFALVGPGASGASITSISGSTNTYTVTVATGVDGTLRLDLVDDDSILDPAGNPLGGTGTGNGDFIGQVYTIDKTNPSVSSITRNGITPTNAATVTWTVTFSESVTGVNAADFTLTTSGLGGTPTVGAVTPIDAQTYTVTADTGTTTPSGSGTIRLDVVDDDSIADGVANPLGGVGAGNGNFTTGEVYTVDKTAPTVSSINRLGASPTNATSVQWTVTFSEAVTGVNAADFSLAQAGGVSGATITSVTGSGPYTVTADSGSNSGTLGLNLVDDDSIGDAATNELGGIGINNGNFTGQVYTLDKTPPVVSSITRDNASPTNAASVQWTVTFSEAVTGVNAADFSLAQAGGVSGASITSVTGGGPYTVTANTGSNSGTLGLDLVDDDSVADGVGNALGGTGTGNGNFTGQVYTLDKTPPFASSINRANTDPTNATSVQWTVTFSEPVTGVGTADFALARTGALSGGSVTSVTGTGSGPYTVTASTGSNSGTLGLNLVDDNSIVDAVNNPLGDSGGGTNGNFTGQIYTIDKTAPTVTSVNRAGASSTVNSGPLTWTVTFSEPVNGVTTSNFTRIISGTGGTAPVVASATATGGAPSATWTVSVSTTGTTGTNSGSIGLNLANNTGVTDVVSNNLSTSTFTGQAYTYDTTAPTLSSINRAGASASVNVGPLSWTVTFSESVNGVTTSNFALATSGTGGTVPSIISATASGGPPSATWTVSVSTTGTTGTNSGSIGLNLANNTGVTDAATNTMSTTTFTGQAYTYDTTSPVPTDVVLANVSGGTAGTVQNGDTLTITYSETLDATSLCSTWSNVGNQTLSGNGSNAVALTITDAGANDIFSVTSVGSCGGSTNFKLGTVSLGGNYVSATRVFSGNGQSVITWNPTAKTLTFKLGTPSPGGGLNPGVLAGTPTYTPSTAIKDLAGNTMSATAFSPAGTSRF